MRTTIRFAPIATADRHSSSRWNRADRTLYEKLRLRPGVATAPLLVNHEHDRQIGVVTDLFRFEDVDGPWWAALADVDDPPAWLERGTPASFAFAAVHRRGEWFGPAERIADGLVNEVSVLSPGTRPAEPLARVLTFRPLDVPPEAASRKTIARRPADTELTDYEIAARAWQERAPVGMIRRPAIGTVLGVR
jgi:hypothetical protein